MTGQRTPLVPDLLVERAAASADGVALILETGPSLTFATWNSRANAFARQLLAREIAAGDRIALLYEPADWLDYAVAYFGALKAGAVAVALSPSLTSAEIDSAAFDCSVVIFSRHAQRRDGAVPSCRHEDIVPGDTDGRGGDVQIERSGDDLAQILLSAGTTGRPKRIGASHDNVLAGWLPGNSAAHDAAEFFVHATPIATNAGQVTMLHPLHDRHTWVGMERFDAGRYCDLLTRYAASHTMLVPATASWLLESGAYGGHDLSSVREVALTAAAVAPAVLRRLSAVFPSAALMNTYTSTEAWPAMTAMRYDPSRPTSVGRPLPGQEVTIIGADRARLAVGQVGEIVLGSARMTPRRYVDDPKSTRDTFLTGGVRTGDLGYLDDDGYLHLVDRLAETINTGGNNVSALEVEAALLEHPAVAEAAVVGSKHDILGETVVAAVVPRGELSEVQVTDFLRACLDEHKVPTRIVALDRLPRNALGKVLKSQLSSSLAMPGAGTASAARTADEAILLRIWSQVLGRDDIGIDDDFVAIGGHSLAAFEIVERAAQALDVTLPRNLVLATPTIAAQARVIAECRRGGTGAHASLGPIRRRAQ